MKNIKKILKSSLFTFILFITLSFFITILSFFNILNYKITNIIKIIIPIISFGFGGFIIGKKALKNGWLEGIKISTFMSITLTIISLITKNLKLKFLIYLIILNLAGIIGSMVGINKKK